LPVRLVIRLGAIGSSMAIVLGLIVFIARLTGFITVPGYAMTVLLICFFSFLNLLGLGIVGSYAWRAYENTKQRPLSIPIKNEYFGESEYHEK